MNNNVKYDYNVDNLKPNESLHVIDKIEQEKHLFTQIGQPKIQTVETKFKNKSDYYYD